MGVLSAYIYIHVLYGVVPRIFAILGYTSNFRSSCTQFVVVNHSGMGRVADSRIVFLPLVRNSRIMENSISTLFFSVNIMYIVNWGFYAL